jgi:hypothetical protein
MKGTTMSEQTSAAILLAHLPELPERDQAFARSLLSTMFPSEKQQLWIDRLAQRVTRKSEPVQAIDNVAGIVELIGAGALHLKHPKVLFQAGGMTLRLSIAGERSRYPGSVNVTSTDRGFDARTWYGRVMPDGAFHAKEGIDSALHTQIVIALRELAANPASVAASYGRKFGRCCFCSLTLSDERSVSVGYGPICADHYGLAWG